MKNTALDELKSEFGGDWKAYLVTYDETPTGFNYNISTVPLNFKK